MSWSKSFPLLLATVLLAGCSAEGQALNQFNEIASKLKTSMGDPASEKIEGDYDVFGDGRDMVYKRVTEISNDVSLNVTKTNSVNSPFAGELSIIHLYMISESRDSVAEAKTTVGGIKGTAELQLIFAYQGGRWVFKDINRVYPGGSEKMIVNIPGISSTTTSETVRKSGKVIAFENLDDIFRHPGLQAALLSIIRE